MNCSGELNRSRIDYVLFHLGFSFEITDELRSLFRFTSSSTYLDPEPGTILFPLSNAPLKVSEILWIDELPVLFSLSNSERWYRIENEALIFCHDILKSAFYLLSGYQEVFAERYDKYNRFPYEGSLQDVLGIIDIPVVNYYFSLISQGIEEFYRITNRPFPRRKLLDPFGFILSHDVDIIDTYNLRDVLFRFKRLFIRSLSNNSFQTDLGYAFKYLREYLRLFDRRNPHWDFDYLTDAAKKRGLRQVFYFLHRDIRKYDSRYTFDMPRIKSLFRFLVEQSCEIGLHGSMRSSSDQELMLKHYLSLIQHSDTSVSGIRQHFLVHQQMMTTRIHENVGFLYDASLGFAEHEGFRHSYCLPFRLYDFDREKMFDLWQIPLIVMDATIYKYRELDPELAFASVKKLLEECKRFNGVFTLLWHNGNFDRENYPNGKALFEQILDLVTEERGVSITGEQFVNDYLAVE